MPPVEHCPNCGRIEGQWTYEDRHDVCDGSCAMLTTEPNPEGMQVAERDEARAVLEKMLDTRRKQLTSCERVLELLQPEWDKFEARTGHDLYVTRDYADHTSAARTHRKEIAALEVALSTLTSASNLSLIGER